MEKIKLLKVDGGIVVVEKPFGVVVNRASSVKGETVQDWAETNLEFDLDPLKYSQDDIRLFKSRSGVAHRLDKDTSGCLLLTTDPKSLIHLLVEFKERRVKKEYLALVHGRLNPSEGVIRLPIARSRRNFEKWEVHYQGKIAETGWRVEKYLEKTDLSLVRLFPLTGRTHQIRVHLSHLGYPLFGDTHYLSHQRAVEDRKLLNRHFLHASVIEYKNPEGIPIRVESELPTELAKLLLLNE